MWEIATFLLASIVKFLFTPSVMVATGYGCLTTIAVTTLGAWIGIAVFFKRGEKIVNWITSVVNRGKKQKVVTPSRRKLIDLKNKYGFAGILLISGLISVPIASILVGKYFSDKTAAMYYLGGAFFVWSIALTALSCMIA